MSPEQSTPPVVGFFAPHWYRTPNWARAARTARTHTGTPGARVARRRFDVFATGPTAISVTALAVAGEVVSGSHKAARMAPADNNGVIGRDATCFR